MTRVGVVGLGYWGPNLARNFDRLPGAELAWLCDESAGRDGGKCLERRNIARAVRRAQLRLQQFERWHVHGLSLRASPRRLSQRRKASALGRRWTSRW